MSEPSKVAVFLHSGEYDRMHQGLSIAATAAAAGRPVAVFFFWWALERLSKDALDAPDLREDVADAFEKRGIPTLRQLLSHLRESGRCRLYACTGSMAILDLQSSGMSTRVDQLVGWSTILSLTAGVTDRFYL